jgi:hypothetical protein
MAKKPAAKHSELAPFIYGLVMAICIGSVVFSLLMLTSSAPPDTATKPTYVTGPTTEGCLDNCGPAIVPIPPTQDGQTPATAVTSGDGTVSYALPVRHRIDEASVTYDSQLAPGRRCFVTLTLPKMPPAVSFVTLPETWCDDLNAKP